MPTTPYKCQRCGYSTREKKRFMSHLKRKFVCSPTLNDVSINQVAYNYFPYDEELSKKFGYPERWRAEKRRKQQKEKKKNNIINNESKKLHNFTKSSNCKCKLCNPPKEKPKPRSTEHLKSTVTTINGRKYVKIPNRTPEERQMLIDEELARIKKKEKKRRREEREARRQALLKKKGTGGTAYVKESDRKHFAEPKRPVNFQFDGSDKLNFTYMSDDDYYQCLKDVYMGMSFRFDELEFHPNNQHDINVIFVHNSIKKKVKKQEEKTINTLDISDPNMKKWIENNQLSHNDKLLSLLCQNRSDNITNSKFKNDKYHSIISNKNYVGVNIINKIKTLLQPHPIDGLF